MTRILLIDNFDSFTLNIAQYLYEVTGVRPAVIPNTTPYEDLPLADVEAVVISPGPGRPGRSTDFGVCTEVVAKAGLPLLGVCLGHQGIAEFFGARTELAPTPAHGIVDTIKHSGTGLFAGLPQDLPVVRYHSLISVGLPDELEVIARTGDDLVMAFAHRSLPVWGVQFHPESVESHGGHLLLTNFVRLAAAHRSGTAAAPAATDAPSAAALAFRRVGGAAALRLEVRPIEHPARPDELFASRYAHRPHSFWLDSENSDRPGSQYSFMGAGGGPGSVLLHYDVTSRLLTLTGNEQVEELTGDLFSLCGEILEGVRVDVPVDWPTAFTGGLVGYLGYELKALTIGEEQHRFERHDAWLLHTRDFVVYDHLAGTAMDCRLVDNGPVLARHASNRLHPPPIASAASPDALPTSVGFVPGPVDEARLNLRNNRTEYLTLVDRAQALITEGETYEVCLTNLAATLTVDDGLKTYLRMRSVSPVPYGAYLRCGDVEVLSSSPETFLRVGRNRVVESRPIKGTRPRGRTAPEDERLRRELSASVKDRAENLMIVDLVRHDFNAVCEPGSVHVSEAFAVESYSSVHQLVSTVRGRLRWGVSAMDAVRACFPGGSMTGAPKKRTMQIIDELEGAPRGVYSGSIGWLSFSGALDLSIVIRTVVMAGDSASFGIGGAITARSDRAEEFTETLVKACVPWYGLRGWQEPVQ